MSHCSGIGRVDLSVVVSAAAQSHQVFIGEVRNELLERWLWPKEVLADVGATSDRVLLELAVHGAVHLANKFASFVTGKEWVPLARPDHLDHIPASAAEEALKLLHDLPVSSHGPVKALQIAVHHPGQVVEPLTRGKGEGTCRLGLIHLAVAEEGPDAALGSVGERAVVQVAVVSRLIDGANPSEPHGDGWELPEIWEESRVRI